MKHQCSRVWPFFLVISALSFTLPQAIGAVSVSHAHPGMQGRATGERYAFIHHMVGNTYSYRLVDWITDLMHIQEDGFDAVALNLGPDCWQSASVALAYKAASQLGNKVKLFLSLDMTSWPQSSDADAAKLATLVNKYVNHPAQFKYRSKAFISTFAGDQYSGSFGRATVCDGWNYFRSLITTANTTGTYFIPAFFPSDIKSVLSCVDGLYHWNSAWSLTADPVSDATDKDWISKLGSEKSYMSNVSPALFTNYGASSLNKQILYNTGNNYAQRWAQVSAIPSIKFVQVSTYNDFGESSYIGARPHSTQLQPATTTWVNAANHLPWERITKPYIEMYKTGRLTLQRSDLIIWEYRLHTKAALAAKDTVGRPPNADWLSDEVYVTAYLSRDAEVRVGMGRNQSTVLKFAGKPGMNHFVAPFPASPDGPVVIGMYRNGTNVGGLQQSEVAITSQPSTYDFNPIVDQFFHDPDWEECLQ